MWVATPQTELQNKETCVIDIARPDSQPTAEPHSSSYDPQTWEKIISIYIFKPLNFRDFVKPYYYRKILLLKLLL